MGPGVRGTPDGGLAMPMTTGILYLDIPVSLWGIYMWLGGRRTGLGSDLTLLYSHMSTGCQRETSGGSAGSAGRSDLCRQEQDSVGWVEPCSCVVSTVRYISGGVGGGQEVRLAEAEEQAAKRMLSRSLGDGSYMG